MNKFIHSSEVPADDLPPEAMSPELAQRFAQCISLEAFRLHGHWWGFQVDSNEQIFGEGVSLDHAWDSVKSLVAEAGSE
jgi:hypothetical protein